MSNTTARFVMAIGMCLLLLSGEAARAQTGQIYGEITGKAVDAQGGILPGVTVSLTGPAIMGAQTTITSERGIYHFHFLPSGTYALRFELQGFRMTVRDGLIVAARTTVTQDATLEVAALEESVTVTGASPVVDAANTKIGERLGEELLAATPTTRSLFGAVAALPGVVLGRQDIGGTSAWSVPRVIAHGATAYQVNVMGSHAEGPQQNGSYYYVDFNMMEEVSVESAGMGAEVGPGGAMINIIPKAGGNDFKGSLYFTTTRKGLAGNNVDDRLRAQGVQLGTVPLRLYDINMDGGGRVVRDRIWWYLSFREFRYYDTVIGFPRDHFAGLRNYTFRPTVQVTPNNKLSATYAYFLKEEPLRGASLTTPPESTTHQESPTHFENVNWTSVLGQRSFLEVASGLYTGFINRPASAEWDALPVPISPSIDLATGVRWGQAAGGSFWEHGFLFTTNAAVTHYRDSWLGANHQIKSGVQLSRGWGNRQEFLFGETEYRYQAGVPTEIQAYNHPVKAKQDMFWIAGFVQDRLSYPRVTLNLGLRYANYEGWLPEQRGGGGSWVPETMYPRLDPGFTWSNFAPRASVSVKATEDGRTLAKVNYGRYYDHLFTGDFGLINPNAGAAVATYRWFGDSNGNGEVDANEYNPAPLSVFVARSNSIDPGFKQPKIDEITAAFERELMPNVGLGVSWIQRWFTDNWADVNIGIPREAYTAETYPDAGPDNIVGTADDRPITLYNVLPEFRGRDAFRRQTVPGTKTYKAFEISLNKRMANNWQVMGSYTYSRDDGVILSGNRKSMADPNDPNASLDSNKYGRDATDQPHAFKLLFNYVAPWRINIGGNVQALTGLPTDRTYRRSLTQGSITVRADRRGTDRNDGLRLLALKVDRPFQIGRTRIGAFLELHNLLNSNAGITYGTLTQAYPSQAAFDAAMLTSTAYFGRPTEILTPRIAKLGVRVEF